MTTNLGKRVVLTIEQIEALKSKLRGRIVDLVYSVGELTVAQIAEELNQKPTALYRHLTFLTDVGLLIEADPVRSEKNFARVFKAPGKVLRYLSPAEASPEMREAIADLMAYELKIAASELRHAFTEQQGTTSVPSAHVKYVSITGWLSKEDRREVNAHLDQILKIYHNASHGPKKELHSITYAARPAT